MSPSRLGRLSACAYAKRSTGRTRLSSATGRGDRASPSTEQGACVQAVSEDPAIEVASVRWERVQLIVDARTISGTPVDTTSLRLVPEAGGEPMTPTRATVDGDRMTIRFNVLVGPGLQPLAPGRWTLDMPVVPAPTLAAADPTGTGTFALELGTERVTPRIDTAARRLILD